MERLESKTINGHPYYYYSKWGWVDGRCRRIWQKYLGKLEDIVRAVEGGGPPPEYAEVFQWGLPQALWQENCLAQVVEKVDQLCPKRSQGLSTGQYIAIAALNRAIRPRSKRSMWEWFSDTILLRVLPLASKAALSSQRFWDHMDRISQDNALSIWKSILRDVVKRESIDLSSISYDGTNFYTFIDTFNVRCQIAKRGKNKQGRNNLRQINYALFCAADGHLPLFYECYDGNRNDAKQFPVMLKKFHAFIKELGGQACPVFNITLIFDKGNNSADNFALLDELQETLPLKFVGSVKLGEHKELAQVSNNGDRFSPCKTPGLEGTKAFRVKKTAYGHERIFVVTYNQNLFNAQWLTLQNDIAKAVERLDGLRERLSLRAAGVITGGKAPTVASIEKQSNQIRKRQYLKRVISVSVTQGANDIPELSYALDTQKLSEIANTYLGKNIIITDREEWTDEQIILAYRSQYIIEGVFKEAKDRETGTWWPQHHWTNSKIKVHGLYCTIALLLRALILRRVEKAGIRLSMKRLLSELGSIREVVNIFKRKRRKKTTPSQSVMTKRTALQDRLLRVLKLDPKRRRI